MEEVLSQHPLLVFVAWLNGERLLRKCGTLDGKKNAYSVLFRKYRRKRLRWVFGEKFVKLTARAV
jgi:hypothetical protein